MTLNIPVTILVETKVVKVEASVDSFLLGSMEVLERVVPETVVLETIPG